MNCIRGLKRFEKSGCPQNNTCAAWITRNLPSRENPKILRMVSQCIDQWMFDLQWIQIELLEGNQVAIETFRNNMTTQGADGETYPKPDPALMTMIEFAIEEKKKIGR